MHKRTVLAGFWTAFTFAALLGEASAQGLLWKLPKEDGTSTHFAGTFTQEVYDPVKQVLIDTAQWDRTMTISSVGKVTVDDTPCRWIEFKTEMRKRGDVDSDPGPVAIRIYKVLIAEDLPFGEIATDKQDGSIPIVYLPIKKGYRKLSEQDQAEPIKPTVLQVFPTLSLVRHFRSLSAPEAADPELAGLPEIKALKRTGENKMESRTFRTTNTTDFWVSEQVPFGLARWRVSVLTETKSETAPRGDFVRIVKIDVDMKYKESRTGAQSELAEQ